MTEQVRHQIGPLTNEQEVVAEREIDESLRDVRRSLTRGR
jgi:hypothetical protein